MASRGIWTILPRSEPRNFASWPAEFDKIFCGILWALLICDQTLLLPASCLTIWFPHVCCFLCFTGSVTDPLLLVLFAVFLDFLVFLSIFFGNPCNVSSNAGYLLFFPSITSSHRWTYTCLPFCAPTFASNSLCCLVEYLFDGFERFRPVPEFYVVPHVDLFVF